MSHEVESMAYFGATPWHGLGCEITDLDTLKDSKAFMIAAGLDWKVAKVEIKLGNELPDDLGYYHLANDVFTGKIVDNQYELVRSDTNAVISQKPVTEDGYKLRQNSQMFELFDPLIDEGKFQFHTAGSLYGGRKVWVLAELMTGFELPGNDQVNNFFLFTMDHSGIGANSAFYTSVRVVCANTCRYAEKNADKKITDTHKVRFNAETMRDAIKLVEKQSVDFEELAKRMAATNLTGHEQVLFFRDVFKAEPKPISEKNGGRFLDQPIVQKAIALSSGQEFKRAKPDERNVAQDHIDRMLAGAQVDYMDEDVAGIQSKQINPGWNMTSSTNTLWGAFNVVTHIEDHRQRKVSSPDGMLDATLYGRASNDPKTRAIDAARKLVGA